MNDTETQYCAIPLCEWEAVTERGERHLCAQCAQGIGTAIHSANSTFPRLKLAGESPAFPANPASGPCMTEHFGRGDYFSLALIKSRGQRFRVRKLVTRQATFPCRMAGETSLLSPRYSLRHGFMSQAHWTNDHREWYRAVYLKSEHWRDLRAAKLRANPCCEKCSHRYDLDVHHLNYRNLFDVTISDLLTVCRPCHEAIHVQEGMPVRPRPNFNRLSQNQRKKIARNNARVLAAKPPPITDAERLKQHRMKWRKCTREQWEKTRL